MPRKKGLGRDVEKSVEVMENTLECLKKFLQMPLKKGLHTNKVFEKDIGKQINDAINKASELSNAIQDLRDDIKQIKPKDKNSSRFAEQRVVAKFLSFR